MAQGTFNRIGNGAFEDSFRPDFSSLNLPSTQKAVFKELISETKTEMTCEYTVKNLIQRELDRNRIVTLRDLASESPGFSGLSGPQQQELLEIIARILE